MSEFQETHYNLKFIENDKGYYIKTIFTNQKKL